MGKTQDCGLEDPTVPGSIPRGLVLASLGKVLSLHYSSPPRGMKWVPGRTVQATVGSLSLTHLWVAVGCMPPRGLK